ncbi:carbonic anhydrase [Desulfovibrio legallii]|uniref:Carbonic anhydrase n=1 Tax=Desulfovibrio legallii TaxID=571438 RepID=A0A1G7R114_9BACT|nr:carbonic anhydrase [Desulfovibrio legallii]SDG04425.1 carbonic anhydrase [Desulfovibrio legallii]
MKTVEHLLQGNAFFQRTYFKKHEAQLLDLVAHGQQPRALFIGCADSRVIPSLITNAPPGQLFVLRNVGNFVAPYKPDEDYHATAAGIEYAVTALNVAEVIICGHTHCGAIEALFAGKDEDGAFVHTRKWLSLGKKAKEMALLALGRQADKEPLLRLAEKLSIVFQIENLMTYPCVRDRVREGSLHVHGWLYHIESGAMRYYDPDEHDFLALNPQTDAVPSRP